MFGNHVVTVLRLEDVNGKPIAKMGNIPCPLKNGDHIGLKFKLKRETSGRHEVLDVRGQFQVTAVGFDVSVYPRRQLLSVESLHKPPTWRSVRREEVQRTLPPAKSPRTPIQ